MFHEVQGVLKQRCNFYSESEAGPVDPAAEEQEEVFFEGTDEEQAAALKIQAMHRGKAARK
eukprot:5274554-Pyramimonas_sp.AAC.1